MKHGALRETTKPPSGVAADAQVRLPRRPVLSVKVRRGLALLVAAGVPGGTPAEREDLASACQWVRQSEAHYSCAPLRAHRDHMRLFMAARRQAENKSKSKALAPVLRLAERGR